MTKTPTYKEQFDKLTRAYINNEVKPNDPCACFCGNLLNNTSTWVEGRGNLGEIEVDKYYNGIARCSIEIISGGFYSLEEIVSLEKIFMDIAGGYLGYEKEYEIVLFTAFEKTLDALREFHISKGEVIDDVPVFVKRTLQPA